MARSLYGFRSFFITIFSLFLLYCSFCVGLHDEFSILSSDIDSFYSDYAPPSPPPPQPSPLPHPPSLLCQEDLEGMGSLNALCELNTSLIFDSDVYIEGNGSLHILSNVSLSFPVLGCSILINISGEFSLHSDASIIAGTVFVKSQNLSLLSGSLINVTGLAGAPPEQTSGTPSGTQGAGGGHGGRGASCVTDSTKLPDDVWGGDAYSWSSLDKPWSYGSKGGTTSKEETYGGEGGGRILLNISGSIEVSGDLLANGGDGGIKGGGGSGGSIYIKASIMTGTGKIGATGGNGFAGGGGGRVSIDAFRRHDNTKLFIHGGRSLGCSGNYGAAGTFYDAVLRSLIICNHNLSTQTDTLLLEFPKLPLWRNVYVQNHAKALVPLYWSRVQVGGVIHLASSAVLSFGLAHFSSSEFELMAEELLMSDSMIKIYGALRMSIKIHLMLNSKILINGPGDSIVATSLLEASNLMVLKESSVIHSNANLGVHGQGLLNLSGPGNLIEAQHLVLSLFYSINVGPGSVLRGPLEAAGDNSRTPQLHCELANCAVELLHPPEDCNINSTLAFTLQICRVEDVIVEGTINGSIVHFHWIRNVDVHHSGVITVSGLGCTGGLGRGRYYKNGLGGGGGHGGNGGDGYYRGNFIDGGTTYGDADLPCELGSGSGNISLAGATAGGGIIVMGSLEHSLSSLILKGSVRADGESSREDIRGNNGRLISSIGPGGGSGGTILLFVQSLLLGDSSMISTAGGHGSPSGGGGGGGGRVHFHWSDIPVGDEYIPLASVKGTIHARGGVGGGRGLPGKNGTISGRECPQGLFGIFCEECPVGTYKNVSGSDSALCHNCPSYELPNRAIYVSVRGGVAEIPCPYKCISDRYHMPNCYTTFEELVYTFGGPWLFGIVLLGLPVLLALVLSFARMKYIVGDDLPDLDPAPHDTRINSFPFLESLNEIMETNRNEESQNHIHRLYFQGPNTFSEPWHLSHCPPEQVKDILYEDAFNRFVDEINILATYHWWEGSIYSIFCIIAYPLAWSWLQRCRRKKLQQLREFVRSEYDHTCLRSCRSRALYEGLKVAATSDLMLAYMDFFLGGDEKRSDLPPRLRQRLPMSIIFGGDGSYLAPFSIHSDDILTSIMSQSVPPTAWYRLVAGLDAQLRSVCLGHLRLNLEHVANWLNIFANPTLRMYGIRVDLAWFQPTASGYCQFGLGVRSTENECASLSSECHDEESLIEGKSCILQNHGNPEHQLIGDKHLMMPRRISGGILHTKSIRTLKEKKTIYYPFSFIIYNTKPVGHQDLVGLLISILLLGDLILMLLTLLQMYSLSLPNFFLVLFVLPFGVLFPFPSGINALFSQGPRRSAGLARLYALWNLTSLVNVVVAFICGFIHYYTAHSNNKHSNFQSWSFSMDESEWWMLPSGLALAKIIQTRLINYHVANQEIKDLSLYSTYPNVFWQS